MKNASKFLMMIALTTAVGIAEVQPGTGGGQRGIPFSALDIDDSGLVTEQEFNQARADFMASRAAEGYPMRGAENAPGFAQMDINGDGVLTAEELATTRQLRREAMRGIQGQGMGRNRPTYAYFDLNR